MIAALLVALPTIGAGFFFDDYLHLLTLRGDGFGATPLDLFLFATGDETAMAKYINTGPYPWYTWPALKLHFFRPLSSATMMLDVYLFGERPVFHHLHSILWYGLLVWAVFLIYRRLFTLPVAGLCILLYIVDEGHLLPVLWLSNRNALVSAAPALLGLAAHLRWREEGWRPGLPLSIAGYATGLLGGETALGIFGFVAAYELLGSGSWRTRARCLAPAALLSVVYIIGYKLGGYGAEGSGVYFDPIGEWRLFLAQAPGRMLELAGAQFFSLPVELSVFLPGAGLLMPLLALALLVLFSAAAQPVWRTLEIRTRRNLSWLLLGSLLATLPALATFPSGRLLTLPSLGACALLGVFLDPCLRRAAAVIPRLSRVIALGLVIIHVVLAPLGWLGASAIIPAFTRLSEDAFRDVELDTEKVTGQRVFCLFAADPYTGFYPVVMRRYLNYPRPLGWQTLSMAPADHEVTRTGKNCFELRVLNGEMLATPFERLMRSHAYPYQAGDVVSCAGFQIRILETGDWGPRKISLEFDKALEDDAYAFLAWQEGKLKGFHWPPIGESTHLKVSEGYFGPKYFKTRLSVL
ncbi:MAG: hypothetical protein JNK74_14555 [Candidatus Hydrogenedentes bacterium]|nr:hypothetical protein [Candidatus Hydrogenedentota bacterium]